MLLQTWHCNSTKCSPLWKILIVIWSCCLGLMLRRDSVTCFEIFKVIWDSKLGCALESFKQFFLKKENRLFRLHPYILTLNYLRGGGWLWGIHIFLKCASSRLWCSRFLPFGNRVGYSVCSLGPGSALLFAPGCWPHRRALLLSGCLNLIRRQEGRKVVQAGHAFSWLPCGISLG